MSSPLTIGLVANTFAPIPGGMEAYLDRLSSALADEGHKVHVVTRFASERPTPFSELFRATEPERNYLRGDVQVHVIAPSPVRRLLLLPTYRLHHHPATEQVAIKLHELGFRGALEGILRECDIVHYSGTGREMLGFAAARVASDCNAPFVITPHIHIGSWGDGPFDFHLYRQAHAMIALTDVEHDALVDGGLSAAKIHVQGHGVNVSGTGDGDRIRRTLRLGNAPVVLFLGRTSNSKGFPLLLEAAATIWERHPKTRFVFAGPPDPTLRLSPDAELVLQDERVHVLGFVSDKMREDLYAACDVFCLPSDAEAFGLVYLEAGLYAKPVIALNIPTLTELIGHSNTGLLATPVRHDVAAKISSLLADAALRTKLGRRGRLRALDRTWKNVANRMADIYRTLLRAPTASPSAVSSVS